ncbi:MAG: hypothetical protein A3H97_16970 [Acidobacteria bacterium RIFCSPLOWO2_02_FULL_65_29]|nr:MAG: hypothetical protein A3H97_16970 [Acidobacteria bacterium RIFCSPLOWO2_02_FULL_65_29]
MRNTPARRLYAALAGLVLLASPARAQFQPRPLADPATGERYHIEASAGFWSTSSDISVSSEALGIIGSTIDFKNDLGLESGRLRELRVVLRPATKHKLRFEVIPIRMSGEDHVLTRTIVFNGQAYRIGVPVTSQFDWKAYRLAYEYDFLARDRWFVGFIVDIKQTDVQATLDTAVIQEHVRARGPIPTLGGIGRFYAAPNISVTAEYTRLPYKEDVTEDIKARYADFGLYGTVNFTNNVGAQIGYRSFDVGYKFEDDTGAFTVKGPYFGIVARY